MVLPDSSACRRPLVTYAHNSAGDLTGILENGATSLAIYVYDNLGRRTSLTRGYASGSSIAQQ